MKLRSFVAKKYEVSYTVWIDMADPNPILIPCVLFFTFLRSLDPIIFSIFKDGTNTGWHSYHAANAALCRFPKRRFPIHHFSERWFPDHSIQLELSPTKDKHLQI